MELLHSQSLISIDPRLERAVRDLRTLSGAEIELLSIKFPPDKDYEDRVAYIRLDGELDTLWKDWSDHREDIFWLENANISGKVVEIAQYLKIDKPEVDDFDELSNY